MTRETEPKLDRVKIQVSSEVRSSLMKNGCFVYLEMSKWAATSPQVSQSSPVILYMLTSPFTCLAIAGVTMVPGEMEYTIGRPPSFKVYAREQCKSVLHFSIYIIWISIMLTEERHYSVPLKQLLSHLCRGHHQIHNHVSLKKKKKTNIQYKERNWE